MRRLLAPVLPHCNRTHPGRKTGGDGKARNLILGPSPRLLTSQGRPRLGLCPIHASQCLTNTRGEEKVETRGHRATCW